MEKGSKAGVKNDSGVLSFRAYYPAPGITASYFSKKTSEIILNYKIKPERFFPMNKFISIFTRILQIFSGV